MADQPDRLEAALREIVRLRLATDEGSCRVRFDRAWAVATAALGDVHPVADAVRSAADSVARQSPAQRANLAGRFTVG